MDPAPTSSKPVTGGSPAPDQPALHFATRILPWLLGALALVIYGLTLNSWITPASLLPVARLQGLVWTPNLDSPVTFLLTRPLGWLPVAMVPLAINWLTAFCAAATLVCLARSVALLPHDLTVAVDDEPPRGFVPPKLLTVRGAWLPPLLAVLACGLQLSFWESAVAGTGLMLNLLMFAWVIRSLLEYNASGRNGWLLGGAFVYGLAMADSWAMPVFFFAFLLALFWVKRLFIFNEFFLQKLIHRRESFKLHLLWQIPACWLAGFSLLLLLPVMASLTPGTHLEFWLVLKTALHGYRDSLWQFPRHLLVSLCLISLTLVFLIGLRFYYLLGGFNRLHFLIGAGFFQFIYGFLLLVCAWIMFDPPLSPRELHLGALCLPLYFLGALIIGWFAGHFLLTCGGQSVAPRPRSSRYNPLEQREQQLLWVAHYLKKLGLVALGVLAVALPAGLAARNLPIIRRENAGLCASYTRQVMADLPPTGAVLIGSDDLRLLYLKCALIQSGRQADCLVLDLDALAQNPDYLDFVRRHNPRFAADLQPPAPATDGNPALLSLGLVEGLSVTHEIYCLPAPPVADKMAELFYYQPHGLLFRLLHYPAEGVFAVPASAEIMQTNAAFWRTFETQQLPALVRQLNLPPVGGGMFRRFLTPLVRLPEPDWAARITGIYYASALNDWGVQVQRTGNFAAAGTCFAEALQLNPGFPAAQINQQFNADHQAGRLESQQKPLDTAASMSTYRDWQHVVRDGLVDEPNFCYMLGCIIADNRLPRPAIIQFERVRELAPSWLHNDASLARLFILYGDYTHALETADQMLAVDPANEEGLLLKVIVHMQTKAYLAAIPDLNQVLTLDPTNRLGLLDRAIARRLTGHREEARQDYSQLTQESPANYQAYFDLAGMDYEETNRLGAITNYELFLHYAPTNVVQTTQVKQRLQALKAATP